MMVRYLARHFRSPRQALVTDHPPHIPIAECLHALEPRYMFDAAGVATGAEVAVDAVAQEQAEQAVDDHLNDSGAADVGQTSASSPAGHADPKDPLLEALATHQPPTGRREIVFVDTSVGDYQTLIAGIDPSAEVVLLDPTRDGVEQIADVLAGRSGIDAIHIVSHGSQAELRLGTARLTLDSMTGRYADELAAIGQTLTEEADLLVYGCDFGQGQLGQEAAITLAKITGGDVAASEDPTGHAQLGGDWDLELRTGSVETTVVFSFEARASFMGLLAAPSIDLDANNSSGTPGADYVAQYPVAGGSLPVTDIDGRLVDADSATLSLLTVSITNLLDGANESLSADTTGTSIMASYISGTGVLALSGADTVGHYQQVLRTITYANAAVAPDRTDRTIAFVATDGASISNVATTTVRWDYVRDEFNSGASYNGNDGSVNWNGGWQEVGESNGPGSGNVQVTSGSLEIRAVIAGVTRGATRDVDLNGAASAVLSFSYQRSSGPGGTTEVYVEVSNDGGGNWFRLATYDLNSSDATPIARQFDLTPYIPSQTQIRFLTNTLSLSIPASSISFDDIDISYDAHGSTPILDLDDDDSSLATGANFVTTFTEGGGAVVVADADAVLSDADSTNLTELVVTIINPLDGAAESLSWNTGATGIMANYDSATFTLTLSGNNAIANYEQVLRTVRYDNSSQNPNTTARTITFQASDGIDHSDVALAAVIVDAVNDPPVIATTGSALAYTENNPATAVDNGLTVSDVDNTTFTGATVTISANYVNGEDVLSFTDQLGITGGWNAATGTLTLTGTTTLANYQVALRTITYTNLSNGPSTLARTVSWFVNDGSANSAVATRTINITAVNDAPVITSNGGGVSASVSIAENATAVTTVAATDADVPAQTLTYSILAGGDGGFFSIDPSTGALSFNTTPNFEAPADAGANNVYDVTVQVSDGNGGTDLQAIAVPVTNVNEPPVVNDQAFSVAENSANGTSVGTVTATDPDVSDTLSYSITAGNTGGAFTIDSAGVITVASTAALDFETNPTFTLTVQVQDLGGLNDTATVTVNLTDANDAPVIISNGGGASASVSIAENTTTVTTVAATDADVPAQSLTYSINGGADQTLFSINSSTGALTFNTAPDFEAPADANADNVYEVTLRASDGSLADTQTLSVTVIPVNDAPVNTVPGPQTVTENTALALSGVSVNDPEGNLSTVALSVANGTLTVTLQGGTTISAGANGSADLTLSGTQADLSATLASLVYQGSYIGPDTVTVTSTDSTSASDTDTIAITVIAAAPADPVPPDTGDGTPEDSLPREVGDGDSSKPSTNHNTTPSADSPVTTSASSAQAAPVSRADFASEQDFSNGTPQGLGSEPPVAKETNAAAASAADVQDANDPYSTLKDNRFVEELNRLRDDMHHQLSVETVALSMGLSVGYAIWLLRGGVILSSLLSSLPAWRWLDPLPVLAHLRDPREDEEGNDDSLQAVLKNAEARDPSKPIPDVEVVPSVQQAATGAALSPPDASASLQEKADSHVSPHIPSPCQGEG